MSVCVRACLLAFAGLLTSFHPVQAQQDWSVWRGPNRNGIAPGDQNPPLKWDNSTNLQWAVKIPGRGHSSPIIVGDRIFLTTADESTEVQSVLCYEKTNGEPIWKEDLNKGGFQEKLHVKNTQATPTISSNGGDLFVVLIHRDQVQLTSLTLEGKTNWQKIAGVYQPKAYQFGYAPSPLLYQDLVIVSSECEADSFLVAYRQADGEEVWRVKRPTMISYSTPIVGTVAGKEQLLLSGSKQISSYSPRTGKLLWKTPAIWTVTCGTMIWEDDLVYASGGYPTKGTMAVRADGHGEVVWTNEVKCYEQSMLIRDGIIYAVSDNGIAFCWDAKTGKEHWKARLSGQFSTSPILVGDRIYAVNEEGKCFIYAATSEKFQALGENSLGQEGFATPVFLDDRIYQRTALGSGPARQEYLVCIGE